MVYHSGSMSEKEWLPGKNGSLKAREAFTKCLRDIHLLAIDLSPGQVVQQGEVVGLSEGTTPPAGNSTGAHLHEGIKRREGDSYEWIDPLQFMVASEWQDTPCR